MKLIAVDDEKLQLDDFVSQLKKQPGVTSVAGFYSAQSAIDYLNINAADAAFLDIQMPEMNGLILAKKIKEIRPETRIIFLTAYPQYCLDAFKLHVSGYLLKPPSDGDILKELEFAFSPPPPPAGYGKKRMRVQTFGNFEVFADGIPVRFSRSKSKEILAYLVDRHGAGVTKKELAAIIWEDCEYVRSKQIQLETLIRELIISLKTAGIQT